MAVSPAVQNTCHPSCTCYHTTMKCDGFIPFTLPGQGTFQELILSGIDSDELQPQRFCHLDRSWRSLSTLAFVSVRANSFHNLLNGVFDCLGNIESFRFKSQRLVHFEIFTFTGLSNVTSLDLSGCSNLNWNDFVNALSVNRTFPHINHLILSGTGRTGRKLYLNQDFINVLSMRPLGYLDLSFMFVDVNFWYSKNVCKTLWYINYAGSHGTYHNTSKPCESLKIVDRSYAVAYNYRNKYCFNDTLNVSHVFQFYADARIILENRIITPSTNFMPRNCSLMLYVGTLVSAVYFSQNYLPNFDLLLINDQITLLNLSKDSIANTCINPKAFEGMGALNELDLSYNELSKVTNFKERFSELFRYSSHLTYVHLNGNGLQYVPKKTFVSNLYLEHLDLSNNSLTQVDFEFSNLLDLKLLNLRSNKIESLDDISRRSLDALYVNQIKANRTDTVQVQLHDNTLSCQCTSLSFLHWVVDAPMFSTTRHDYKCQLDGQHFLLEFDGVNAAKEDCERARRKRLKTILLSTLKPSGALVILVTSLLLYKRYKTNLRRRRFADGIRRLRENDDTFPVFLSYSSDDNDFVRRHMLQQMQVWPILLTL